MNRSTIKQMRYAWGWKIAAIILNEICAVVMVLSIILCFMYVGTGGIGVLNQDRQLADSVSYQSEVKEQVFRCIRAACRENKFEQDGKSADEIQVDILEYAATGRIPVSTSAVEELEEAAQTEDIHVLVDPEPNQSDVYGRSGKNKISEEPVTYALGDLLDWTENAGIELYTLMRVELEDGTLIFISDEQYNEGAWKSAYPSEEKRVNAITAVREAFAPEGYLNLEIYAEEHGLGIGELQDLHDALYQTLTSIYQDYQAYQENLEIFHPSMTNMRYMILPLDAFGINEQNFDLYTATNFITIDEKLKGTDDFLKYFRGYDSFLLYNSSTMEFESSGISMSLSDITNYLRLYQPSITGDYVLAIAIDPDFRASDNLKYYKDQYEQVQPIGRYAFYGMFIGTLLYFITLGYLTFSAGRRATDDPNGERKIHLNWFDRIFTEPAALIVSIPAAAILFFAVRFLSKLSSALILEYMIVGGSFLLVLNMLFLFGYLSVIRRARSRTLWKNSLIRKLRDFSGDLRFTRHQATRIFFEYVMFIAVNVICLVLRPVGFVFAGIFDLGVAGILLRRAILRQRVIDGISMIADGEIHHQIPTEEMSGDILRMANAVNRMGEGFSEAVEQSVLNEKMKSDLITNVTHDIKTPLTSIVSYVDLLKKEEIGNERAENYIRILEEKAQRLKTLTEDLVEVSRITSGNVTLEMVRLDFQELLQQTNGEFEDRFAARGLKPIVSMPDQPMMIEADGRYLWRIIENLYSNAAKYAMSGTRIYIDLIPIDGAVSLSVKNISEHELNINASELMERFIRGDGSRTTEGSGLGLAIAKNLTELMNGQFDIYLDGDLFRATVTFPLAM